MEQPLGLATQSNASDCADFTPFDEFSRHDLLDLTGPHVRQIAHFTDQPDSSRVRYHCGTDLSFAQIAAIIPCFTAGTMIATPDGEIPAEALRPGDRVLTRDNGLQIITWAGQKTMTMQDLPLTSDMRPVRIRKGALGQNCPERDMVVSPNHRMLIAADHLRDSFAETEMLLAAKHMTYMPGVDPLHVPDVTYIHFMCAQHEIVFSDGTWTETFQPNDDSLHGIDAAKRTELLTLFPELACSTGRKAYRTARKTLSQEEAMLVQA
ncbi:MULTISPECIES: Hint domain-containing protein [unclassified Yoonia]|uniref:Hint domain-containing protein n=1 Tax=unclassified Yoonia TaxID=2629118 RepID=UPI002AFFDBD6|nr:MULTISPECIES: Hint domain-containing protein [unclassified Yoonia]